MTAEHRPVALDAMTLREGLVGRGLPWRQLDVVAETSSTNADLLNRAAGGEDIAGAVLLAEHQTAGRGRAGRTWTGVPRAMIAMSVGVSTEGVSADGWGWLALATGVAVVDAVASVTGIRAALKWPNDVLAAGGKLAGILAEVASPAPVVVVGIGLNVTVRPDELPVPGATSLLALGADTLDRTVLTRALLAELAARYAGWRQSGGTDPKLMADYRSRSITIGSRVRAMLPGEREIVGDATGVDGQGRLLIADQHGGTVAVSAGDVVHLR